MKRVFFVVFGVHERRISLIGRMKRASEQISDIETESDAQIIMGMNDHYLMFPAIDLN